MEHPNDKLLIINAYDVFWKFAIRNTVDNVRGKSLYERLSPIANGNLITIFRKTTVYDLVKKEVDTFYFPGQDINKLLILYKVIHKSVQESKVKINSYEKSLLGDLGYRMVRMDVDTIFLSFLK